MMTMSEVIPAEAVEAAAKVLIREQSHGSYEYHPEGHPKRDDMDRYAEKHARAALEAAAPHIIATHFREINRKAIAHEIETPLQFKKDAPNA